ncbi:MAG TPA: type II toxin-antitoxin system RelE/ParE family toxin [Algoriphagus sp.]|jgi:plasmid stabilization system protein ParE|nr:type II toxin-antitoxin system RelE/ParE family toxin [Algoriphagus sp.]
MSLPFELTEEAKKDIGDSFTYYESEQPGLGTYFLEKLDHCFRSISENPFKHPSKRRFFREALVSKFPFLVVFEVLEDKLLIYAVFHTSKNPRKKPRKKKP